jgi:hypothetical protein
MDREDFQDMLESIMNTSNVFFQPPPAFKLSYPCIVYSLDDLVPLRANNEVYKLGTKYQVTYIDANPDSSVVIDLANLPRARFIRTFRADNLNHYVFTISTL